MQEVSTVWWQSCREGCSGRHRATVHMPVQQARSTHRVFCSEVLLSVLAGLCTEVLMGCSSLYGAVGLLRRKLTASQLST